MAKIVILNGTSSAGKSTLAGAIQRFASGPVLRVSMDDFLEMMPPRFANDDEAFSFQLVPGAEPAEVEIGTGSYGAALMRGMRTSVAALADQGLDLVVDDVMLGADDQAHYREVLAKHSVTFVAVRCSLETAEQRERARGDRDIGMARWQYSRVHAGHDYDLEVWTDEETAEVCARMIVEAARL
ncbi:chloramphenicol phosphotransferase CPT family protein [Henriciella litoralis]|uniref:chloramphenicol phosphotransferase CPT family protein n=1 Tax=Henriciella litoralis TaxID=568102 RepID=UPI000A0333C3|nr:AAA family ATPase [Henriciella litoralis]